MNFRHKLLQSTKKNISFFMSVFLLSVATGVTLFALEASSPLRFATNEALAWHCEIMTASPETITLGGSSMLEWRFAADSDITVTIDQLSNQEWTGVSGSVSVSPTETTTYTAIAHKAGIDEKNECSVTVTVRPPEAPRVPICPFTPSEDVTVVDFNSGLTKNNATTIFSDGSGPSEISKAVAITAGKYTVYTFSWDGYASRIHSSQPNEQWNVEIRKGTKVIDSIRSTDDLAEYVIEAQVENTFPMRTYEDGDTVMVLHAAFGDETSPNSVVPVCVAFEKEIVEEQPWCELSANPNSIIEGGQATLTWNSSLVSSVDITEIGTGLSTASSTLVTPATTTTYVGTFYPTNTSLEPLTCQDTITVRPPTNNPEPVCTLSASPTVLNKGQSTTLTWTSDEVTSAVIDQGIGSVALDGSMSVIVNANTTYTGTFKDDSDREVTCSARVSVKGGGGKCLNCGDDDDDEDPEPSIILGKTITRTGGSITLDQVPYTGFKASLPVTIFFWVTVLALSILIAYTMTRYHLGQRVRMSYAHGINQIAHNLGLNSKTLSVSTPIQYNYVDTMPEISNITARLNDSVAEIEEMAHKENILLSPEALRLIQSKVQDTESDTILYLSELIEKAKAEYPREDGWILLSKERAHGLLQAKSNNTSIPVENNENVADVSVISNTIPVSEKPFRVNQKPLSNTDNTVSQSAGAPSPRNTFVDKTKNSPSKNLVSVFMGYLLQVQKKEAFDLMRNISTRGIDVATFITLVVRQLDEVYKQRIEGNRNPDQELIKKTELWSNEDFETVLGILVECIDYSYSSNRIGTKIALAKIFEHFENKK